MFLTSANKPSVPEDLRLYAVGDIHGCVDLLERLAGMIKHDVERFKAATYRLVFLGDYVDRGVDSKNTIQFLLHGLPTGMEKVFIRGNHDHEMLEFLKGNFERTERWLTYGGAATLASYGVNSYRSDQPHDYRQMRYDLASKIPPEHRAFMDATRISYGIGDYHFVHAGVRPGIAIAHQTATDQMWIRQDFIHSKADFGKIVVHGHTIAPQVDVQCNRIGVDTGAYASGHLSCLVLQGNRRAVLST